MRIQKKQQGSVIIMTGLLMLPIIAAIGLAIDSGIGYIIKARLNTALDSASIAAARAVTQGSDQATQAAYAKQAARDFFAANYNDNYLNSVPVLNEPSVSFDGGKVTIDLSASATVPVTFARVMGFDQLVVGASAQSVRKDLDMALVMDTSGSLSSKGAAVRSSAITFLSKFSPTTDRVGLSHFAYGAVVDDAIKTSGRGFNRTLMTTHINNFAFTGSTNSSEGMWTGRNQLNGITQINRSSLRVIVFFSDGSPNSFASYFPFKTASDCSTAGTIATGDGTTVSNTSGLYRIDQTNTQLTGKCITTGGTTIASKMSKLPDWYNAHNSAANPNDPNTREFPIVTNTPRVVSNDLSTQTTAWRNVNRASRNLVEAVASKARDEGIYI